MTVHSTRCPAAEQRADRRRPAAPGQDNRKFVDGFRGLKQIGCQDFCSPDQPRPRELPLAITRAPRPATSAPAATACSTSPSASGRSGHRGRHPGSP